MSANYEDNHNKLKYVSTINFSSEKRYILGTISQKTLGFTFRVDLNMTPEISILYYGSPFNSRGTYSDFKRVVNPDANVYEERFAHNKNVILSGARYLLDENNDFVPDYDIGNPDFNFHQFRSNLVAKWECRLGSFIYLFWSREKTGNISSDESPCGNSSGQLRKVIPNDIFLIKLNYWFSLKYNFIIRLK